MKYKKVSWEKVLKGVKHLYSQVSKNKYDGVICISTGGLLPGKLLSEYLALPLGVVSASRYGPDGKELPRSYFNTHIVWSRRPAKFHNFLVVDDIADNGLTLEKVCGNFFTFMPAKEIDIAVLYFKPDVVKDRLAKHKIYRYEDIDEGIWIIFPWEVGFGVKRRKD